jgi:hypothetical protein
VDDGTWVVAVTLAGYSFSGASLVVTGNATPVYLMTLVAITPPALPGQTTAYSYTYNQAGVIEPGVVITAVVKAVPASLTGVVLDGAVYERTSDSSGLVQFPNLFKGVTYVLHRGTSKSAAITIPLTAGSTFLLPDFVGSD